MGIPSSRLTLAETEDESKVFTQWNPLTVDFKASLLHTISTFQRLTSASV